MKGLIEEVRGGKGVGRKKEGEMKEKMKDKHGTGSGQERQAGPQRPLHDLPWCLFVYFLFV